MYIYIYLTNTPKIGGNVIVFLSDVFASVSGLPTSSCFHALQNQA